jgi:hypothetical protein
MIEISNARRKLIKPNLQVSHANLLRCLWLLGFGLLTSICSSILLDTCVTCSLPLSLDGSCRGIKFPRKRITGGARPVVFDSISFVAGKSGQTFLKLSNLLLELLLLALSEANTSQDSAELSYVTLDPLPLLLRCLMLGSSRLSRAHFDVEQDNRRVCQNKSD